MKNLLRGIYPDISLLYPGICHTLSNWTKIFTVIASEGKQSQPLRLLHFTSFHMANATQRLRNDIV